MSLRLERVLSAHGVLCLLCALCIGLAGCAPAPTRQPPSPTPAPAVFTPPPTETSIPPPAAPTPTTGGPQPSPTPEPRVAAGPEVCSPLDGIEIAVLNQPDLLKNPFAPPQPGKDDGHFGIDLAYWADAEGRPMQGLPVRAALAGVVAGVIQNRYPYGNAVIIETPLDNISPQLLARLDLPEPSGELHPAQSLTCPEYAFTPPSASRSLYTLYAHLEQPPLVEAGQTVACGDPLGAVGTTGRSVNPHLHLEARAGPAGMVFPSMAHYDTSASADEMRLYCLWRVSGAFEAFDPLNLFGLEMPAAVK